MSGIYREDTSKAWDGFELRPGMKVKMNPFEKGLASRYGSNYFDGELTISGENNPMRAKKNGETYFVQGSNWWYRKTLLVKGIDYE